ncbi:MAG: pyruvate kinase [Oscillospiraceae bacterium]|nr:pyruvate kinase [Oscillospiraceae bacterium]
MRKTKIVCTIGPSTDNDDVMRQLMKAGMNVARFNFSHGEHETHKARFEQIVRLREELALPIATLMDTRGPEIRLKKFKDNKPVEIHDGDTYTLTINDVEGTNEICSVTFENLPKDISLGTHILINDGAIEMIAEKITGTDVICKVIRGGVLSNNKGINIPGAKLSMPYISDADMNDLEFGAKIGFDFIAASFVRSAADINYLRKLTKSFGWYNPRIIAKIENSEGVENIDEILEAADGIMIARGDMGVEIPFEQIPAIQKELIKKGYRAGKQVITATQMLESMIKNSRPTRAEITDVANAIYDGTSAIMLSGETAAGDYPVEAVKTMALIASTTEKDINYVARFEKAGEVSSISITDAISHATVTTAHDLDAAAIITVTKTGKTARMISKYRPNCPIVGFSTDETACRQLNMSWGVLPGIVDEQENTDDLLNHAVERAVKYGYVKHGDLVVLTAGVPLGVPGATNLLKVQVVD